MTIEEMFGDLYSIDIMAEKKTGEIVLFLICYGFIDGEEKLKGLNIKFKPSEFLSEAVYVSNSAFRICTRFV